MHNRFTVCLGKLPESGWQWHGRVAKALLMDPTCGTVAPLTDLIEDAQWDARLQRKGDCYHLTGIWRVRARRQCGRCTADFAWAVQGTTLRDYRLGGERVGFDDEVLALPGEVNLLDVLREDIWLAWDPCVVCSPECKGLCPDCGKDLNEGPCGCTPSAASHPFAVLARLKI